jgi:hypothetical protein
MWAKVKAFCLGSVTIAWSYFLAVMAIVLEIADDLSTLLADSTVQTNLQAMFGNDPKLMARILLGIAVINIIARMRTLKLGP